MKLLSHLKPLAQIRCLMRIWKEPKTGIKMLTLHFVPMALICLRLPPHEHLIILLLPESTTRTSMEAVNPLPKASLEGKQLERKSQKSEILPETSYKMFIESKEIKSK
jgi:hypothetical protein